MRNAICGLVLLLLLATSARADELRDLRKRFASEKDQPYATRITTVQAIAALGTEPAARFLLDVIDEDADRSMRLNTIHQIARMPHGIVFERLLRYVRTNDADLASTAFHAIAYYRTEPLPEDVLARILGGSDQNMRSNAIRYLARRGDERFVTEAERFLSDFPTGATSLTSVLTQARTPAAARILLRIYDDKRKYDRDQVTKMFEAVGADVRAVLLEALASQDRRLMIKAGTLCARAKVIEAEAALVQAIPSKDPELHAVLVEALGAIGAASQGARQAILDALASSDGEIRVAAVRALRGAVFREAVVPLIDLLESSKDRIVSAETAVTLERLTGQQYGGRADLWRRWWGDVGATFDLAAVKPPAEDVLPQVLVDLAIERGAAALQRVRAEKPPWTYASHGQGTTALVVLALHAAGFDRKDRDVKAGLSYLVKAPVPETTYDTGLVAMALEAVTGKRHRRRIGECARRLMATQNDAGFWGYPTGDGDNSNTQYAVLGLRAAARAGVKVPERVWKRIRDHFLGSRGDDGGWAYTLQNRSHSSCSMTGAGVCCLLVCLENLTLDAAEEQELQAAIAKGYEALGTLMKIDKDTLYALYGIERAGVLGGRSTMAGHAWYAPGARRLVEEQGRDGLWTGNYAPAVETAFAILFLKRATVPVAAAVTTR